MKFFLILLLILTVPEVYSQDDKSVRLGIKAGANLSHINFSKSSSPPENPILTNWQPGLVAGFVVIVPIYNDFFFNRNICFPEWEENLKEKINSIK